MFSRYMASSPSSWSWRCSIGDVVPGSPRVPGSATLFKTEDAPRLADGGGEKIDLFLRIIKPEAGAGGAVHETELAQERHGAVMAAAHADAFGVEDGGEVVRVHAVDLEGDHAGAGRAGLGTDDAKAVDLAQLLDGVGGEHVLVLGDLVDAGQPDVVDGRAETDDPADVRRARLELPGNLVPSGMVPLHLADHVAAE